MKTTIKKLDGTKCPECPKVCKTLAGLSKHMNMMHLKLSPSQMKQAEKTL